MTPVTPTATNPITGIEYYTSGPLDGKSVALFVNVSNGNINNPSGDHWPTGNGGVHDFSEEFYEYVPFRGAPFDTELKFVDSENSGRFLKPAVPKPPTGHPQGTYEETRVLKRRSKAELKTLARGYWESNNRALWPQENGYNEKLAWAEKQIAAQNDLPEFLALVERHQKLLAASFHNDRRLAVIYTAIEEAGETGNIDDWPFSKMQDNSESATGWVNGIEE
jgi:hypothetical protein